jgi:hypothetical protein
MKNHFAAFSIATVLCAAQPGPTGYAVSSPAFDKGVRFPLNSPVTVNELRRLSRGPTLQPVPATSR